jgi:hypothetical protein
MRYLEAHPVKVEDVHLLYETAVSAEGFWLDVDCMTQPITVTAR